MLVLNIIAIFVILILSWRKEIENELEEEDPLEEDKLKLQADLSTHEDINNKEIIQHIGDIADTKLRNLSGNDLNEQQIENKSLAKLKGTTAAHLSVEKTHVSILNPANIKNEIVNVLENPNFHKILVV